MKKIIYIIPGWEETCKRKPYQLLAEIAEKKGYEVVHKNVDWNKELSSQIFPVSKDAIIIGFSLGAVLAWLIAQNYECKHIILASMTPYYYWKDKKMIKELINITGLKFVNDIIKNINPIHLANKQTIMYGDKENESGDIIVPNTGHRLSKDYFNEINKIL